MIKRFNENWGELNDIGGRGNKPKQYNTFDEYLKNEPGSSNDSEKERWKQYWNKMSRDINFEMDTIAEYAMKNSISYEDAQKHFKNNKSSFEVGDRVINKYTKDKSIIISKKLKDNGTLYEIEDINDGHKSFSIEAVLSLDKTANPKFENGFEIIGLPSGQLIYMNLQQLNYFKARDKVKWTGVWKKPTAGGFYPINIESYTFEDKFYKNIIDMLDTITWN